MLKQIACVGRAGLVLAASAIGIGGCANSESSVRVPEEQGIAFGQPGIVVTTNDGTRYEGPGLQLQMVEGQLISAGIGASTPDGTTWTASFYLEPEHVGGSTVELARKPPTPGIGYVAIREADEYRTLLAESVHGQLTFQLHQGGTVDGEASTEPSEASATFTGKYGLSCWVLPETIGQEQNGSGDGLSYVEDVAMASEFCQQFQQFR
jgi:hypothetical protein